MTPTFNHDDYLSADELAQFLGYPPASPLPPDTVHERQPYWSRETAQALIEVRAAAIRSAFGYNQEPKE